MKKSMFYQIAASVFILCFSLFARQEKSKEAPKDQAVSVMASVNDTDAEEKISVTFSDRAYLVEKSVKGEIF